jgi:hypothetical protein
MRGCIRSVTFTGTRSVGHFSLHVSLFELCVSTRQIEDGAHSRNEGQSNLIGLESPLLEHRCKCL